MLGEYDGNNNLLRKYIYGPGVDQPVSMIEVDDNNAAYYYHFDALGSVVALSDSTGDTVQTYEYSVYGEVSASDPNHPNPYMFAGRRYDIEIGLYYNRARYYNPYTGRFLQTDPIGYEDGMNWYLYCRNSPLSLVDPSGTFADWDDGEDIDDSCDVDVCDVCNVPADFCDVYMEWTGEWKLTSHRRAGWQDVMCGSIKHVSKLLKGVSTALTVTSIVEGVVKTLTGQFWCPSPSQIADSAASLFISSLALVGDIPEGVLGGHDGDGYKAWIEVKMYRKREGFDKWWKGKFGDDGYDYLGKKWIEVTANQGSWGRYWTRTEAEDAIGVAISNLPYRPRDSAGNLT